MSLFVSGLTHWYVLYLIFTLFWLQFKLNLKHILLLNSNLECKMHYSFADQFM